MHKLIDYICDELEELERKADKGKLSMAELQYVDLLAHAKKNILTADAMMEADEGGSYDDGGSYARGRGKYAKRDSMGRYSSRYSRNDGSYDDGSYDDGDMSHDSSYDYSRSRGYSRANAKHDLITNLHELERNAKDEESRHMVKKWIKQAEEQ